MPHTRQHHTKAVVDPFYSAPQWAVLTDAIRRRQDQRLWAIANNSDDYDRYLKAQIEERQDKLLEHFN